MSAKLTKVKKIIEVETEEDAIELNMSVQDAIILSRILANVGGPPEGYRGSADRIIDDLTQVLQKHKITYLNEKSIDAIIPVSGSIYFHDTGETDVARLDAAIRANIKK